MHIVTFYSFKGGTGRSMALVNVAADLLARGRKVLIVDFDLEAPGLDTFPMKLDRRVDRGLVEMITDYLDPNGEGMPSVQDYVYEAQIDGVNDGLLWMLPAGRQDASYDSRFRCIDWQDFYQDQGGFLFFEDLKIQWRQVFNPDYVLIDSRTGHTDTGGICTRQLPDCVVAMFYPNEQNLRGLAPVVQDIRNEETGPLKKVIGLHFVMGNVPDLDDEDAILSNASSVSQKTLRYEELATTIHHFSSFSMLTQRLLLVDRPRSKIAAEYRQLASAIVRRNLEDRDGAISFLNEVQRGFRGEGQFVGDRGMEGTLQTIRTLHSRDEEVLRGLGRIRRMQRRNEEAFDLFEQILELNENDPESLVGRAEILTNTNRSDEALRDLVSFFGLTDVSPFSFELATRLLLKNDKCRIPDMLGSPAVPSLPVSSVLDIVRDLQEAYETCGYGASLIRDWLASSRAEVENGIVSLELSLCLIGAGRFKEAQQEIDQHRAAAELDLANSFNYAMAEWGSSGTAPRALFEGIIPNIEGSAGDTDVNHLQCFSLAYWAIGNIDRALQLRDEAVVRFAGAPRTIFSAWSYLYRSPKDFKLELDAMGKMYSTGQGLPAFIREIPGHL
jgi:MinD-like ATPase involved in chromosome partitioning or flagellar assembly